MRVALTPSTRPARGPSWSRAALLLFALTLVAACEPRKPPAPELTPPTGREAEAFAGEFARAMTPCDPAAVNRLVDMDSIITRAVAGRDVSSDIVAQIRAKLSHKIGEMMCKPIAPGTTYTYLHLRDVNGSPRPLFRLVDGGGAFNYHELELDQRSVGVRIADVYIYGTGERLSDTFGRIVDGVVKSGASAKIGDQVGRVNALLSEGRFVEAEAALRVLPSSIREMKAMMLVSVVIAQKLGDDVKYLAALDAYTESFPDDPSLDLLQIDGAFSRKNYDEEIAILDRLDKRLGGDPYLDALRGATYAAAGNHEKALELTRRATAREPTLEAPWWQLITEQAAAEDFAGAIVTLGVLRDRFKADINDASMRGDDRFKELTLSKDYAAFRAASP